MNVPLKRMTKSQRLARDKLSHYLWLASQEEEISTAMRAEVPLAWYRLATDLDVLEPKTKVTLRLDESVAKFFRAMGPGYQARINRILGTWAQLKIGEALEWEQKINEIQQENFNAKVAESDMKRWEV